MRYSPRATAAAVGLVALSPVLAGCGGEAAVCEDADALRTSVQGLQDIQVGEEALAELSGGLEQITADLEQLRQDASDEFSAEVDAVLVGVDGLGDSLRAAEAEPSAASLGEVAGDVETVVRTVSALDDAVRETCE